MRAATRRQGGMLEQPKNPNTPQPAKKHHNRTPPKQRRRRPRHRCPRRDKNPMGARGRADRLRTAPERRRTSPPQRETLRRAHLQRTRTRQAALRGTQIRERSRNLPMVAPAARSPPPRRRRSAHTRTPAQSPNTAHLPHRHPPHPNTDLGTGKNRGKLRSPPDQTILQQPTKHPRSPRGKTLATHPNLHRNHQHLPHHQHPATRSHLPNRPLDKKRRRNQQHKPQHHHPTPKPTNPINPPPAVSHVSGSQEDLAGCCAAL